MIQLARAVQEEAEVSGPVIDSELAQGISAERRPQLAARLGSAFAAGKLSPAERLAAIEIFKCLARDAEIEVRRTLAEHIKCSPLLPQSIAVKLAEDVESVAVPILQSSLALSDDDLVAIIAAGNTAKQCAIAERPVVSEVVSSALVDTGKKAVVETLLANGGAEISEASFGTLLNTFGDDPEIQVLLIDRPALPCQVKERLVCFIADDLQARLIEQHEFPAVLAEQLTLHGREQAILQSLASLSSLKEIEPAVMRIYLNGQMTSTLLLRALCHGKLEVFSGGIATLARVPGAKAHKALCEAGPAALQSLYARTSLPAHLRTAFRVALEVALEVRREGKTAWEAAEEKRIVHALVQSHNRLSPDGLESVLSQLSRLSPDD
jgi:uncharacterized protein (DUF2336 family)